MPFKKGESGNPNGRPKGARDKVTAETRAMFMSIMEGQISHVADELDLLREESPEKYLKALSSLLPYFMPKQTETEVTLNVPDHKPSWFTE